MGSSCERARLIDIQCTNPEISLAILQAVKQPSVQYYTKLEIITSRFDTHYNLYVMIS